MTSFNQLDWIISEEHSYANLKFVYDKYGMMMHGPSMLTTVGMYHNHRHS